MPMYFRSRRDAVLGVVLGFSVLLVLGLFAYSLLNPPQTGSVSRFIYLFTFTYVAALAWIWWGTGYWVTEGELWARCGPLRRRIDLARIRFITANRNADASPALSIDRLAIRSEGGADLFISPESRNRFLQVIQVRVPGVRIDENAWE